MFLQSEFAYNIQFFLFKFYFHRLQDGGSNGNKSFFTEIVASISDLKFATDGRHVLSRDYMNLKVSQPHWTQRVL